MFGLLLKQTYLYPPTWIVSRNNIILFLFRAKDSGYHRRRSGSCSSSSAPPTMIVKSVGKPATFNPFFSFLSLASEQQTHFRSSLLSLRKVGKMEGRDATTGNASVVRRLSCPRPWPNVEQNVNVCAHNRSVLSEHWIGATGDIVQPS